MGVILSRFRKKKKSTTEILEDLDQEITKLEQYKKKNQENQKWFIARLLLYSILFYIVVAVVFYFYYFPEKWRDRLLYSIPLLFFPLIIWCVKKILHWYFIKRIARNDVALEELREKKKQILEDVMETETYKKAKEILEKFDPARFKEIEGPKSTPTKPTPGTELRQRQFLQRSPQVSQLRPSTTQMRPQQGSGIRPGMTPLVPKNFAEGMQPRILMSSPHINGDTQQGPSLPRPILPRERGKIDRLLEYLVGDGPQNRYALICASCFSHNGMAVKEEFEYITFRCCYCYTMNPARKRRPYAPKIDPPKRTPDVVTSVSTPDEESEEETDEINVGNNSEYSEEDEPSELIGKMENRMPRQTDVEESMMVESENGDHPGIQHSNKEPEGNTASTGE